MTNLIMTSDKITLFFVWCWLVLAENRAVKTARQRARRLAQPERARETYRKSAKEFRQRNPGRAQELCQASRDKKPEHYRAYWRQWKQEESRSNPAYRIKRICQKRIWEALISQKATKTNKSEDLLGAPIVFVRQHLSSLFLPGMSWENFGKWHIDHKRPCASFDLTEVAQQKLCFNYRNLQPLWARDNISKGAKWGGQLTWP